MKRVLLFFLAMTAIVTACDPDWAMNPKNQGYAYIVNGSESDIVFKGYTLFTGDLYTEKTIQPGDTVLVSSAAWDERSSNWEEIESAGWDPFLATFAKRNYMVNRDEFNEMHHTVSILTSPTDSLSWVLDVNNIDDDSIFNESNWEKEESESEIDFRNFAWYYTFKGIAK